MYNDCALAVVLPLLVGFSRIVVGAHYPTDVLASGSYTALLIRCARYAVIAFVDFGVYPMVFRVNRVEGQK